MKVVFVSNADTELLALRVAAETLVAGSRSSTVERSSGNCDGPSSRERVGELGADSLLISGSNRVRDAEAVLVRGFSPEREDAILAELPGAGAVIVRLLGGARSWPGGMEEVRNACATAGVALFAFGGEAWFDAETAALSTVPGEWLDALWPYLVGGGAKNLGRMLQLCASLVAARPTEVAPADDLPAVGRLNLCQIAVTTGSIEAGGRGNGVRAGGKPRSGRPSGEDGAAVGRGGRPVARDGQSGNGPTSRRGRTEDRAARPRIGVVLYRAQVIAGNVAFAADLCRALEDEGCEAIPVYTYSLRRTAGGGEGDGHPVAKLLAEAGVDGVITTTMAGGAYDAESGSFDGYPLAALEVPVLQAICSTAPSSTWRDSPLGLPPIDVAMSVAMPEVDGRIVTVPFSFKEVIDEDGLVGATLTAYRTDPSRTARVAQIAARTAGLRHIASRDKRVAIVLSAYPTKRSRLGNAVGLDTPASCVKLLRAMRDAGYRVDGLPENGDALMHALADGLTYGEYRELSGPAAGEVEPGSGGGRYGAGSVAAGGIVDPERELAPDNGSGQRASGLVMDAAGYFAAYERLDSGLRQRMEEAWLRPTAEGAFRFTGLDLGNVLVAVQPPRGTGGDPVAIYHSPDLPPTHEYVAFYRWLDEVWGADAIVHLGKHGTLEWLPGKGVGLSASCAPDGVLGSVPLVYPFIVNDPGEGIQAKRRSHAVIVDHLVPPLTTAESYGAIARLESLLDEHTRAAALDPGKLPAVRRSIVDLIIAERLHEDLAESAGGAIWRESGWQDSSQDALDGLLSGVDGYICELKDSVIRGGLHVLGEAPQGDAEIEMLKAMTRLAHGDVPSLRGAVGRAMHLEPEGSDRERIEEEEARLIVELRDRGFDPAAVGEIVSGLGCTGREAAGLESVLQWVAADLSGRLRATVGEIGSILRALAGRNVAPGPAGAPSRGMANVLPTGRNFYSADPRAIPSPFAWETGKRLADGLAERYLAEEGRYPRSVGIVVWGTATMRTTGDDIAEALALLGVKPVWDLQSGRVTSLELVSTAELGRPRIDVVLRVSGLFRDAFFNVIELFDQAVSLAAGAREPEAMNPVRASGTADARVFGPKPGSYGCGVLELMETGKWEGQADLAMVYLARSSYAYGGGHDGQTAEDSAERRFAAIDVALKNQDNREHDIFDSDDYFQDHGGLIAAAGLAAGRAAGLAGGETVGQAPRSYFGDSSNPERVRVRSLDEEAARVIRSRVVNPKWIAGMMRHGYKGGFEMSATVDYLFGYDATASVGRDWMYEAVTRAYAGDPEVRDFLLAHNPWALQAIVERLYEAVDRGMWGPSASALSILRDAEAEFEGWGEDRA